MAPLTQSEKSQLTTDILQSLSQTPYGCSSLTQLTNGTTNFVFRGALVKSLGDGSDSVIVKYSAAFAVGNKEFEIDVSRCLYEELMLHALKNFHYTSSMVKVPHLYQFDKETKTQVLEDFPVAIDLKSVLVSSAPNSTLSQSLSITIGHALGSWLQSFHTWTSAPSQADLLTKIGDNEPMRKLKFRITYDSFIDEIERFPEVLGVNKEILEKVKGMAIREFEKMAGDLLGVGDEWGIIHGDFWSGNVLLPSNLRCDPKDGTKLFVVDWEFTQFGHRAYDIGQMIGDLYECKYFHDTESTVWVIRGFLDGYGAVSEDMAFRIAVHTGIQLICWCKRGPPVGMREEWKIPGFVEGVVRIGMEFVVRGWERDRDWLKSSMLGGLFRSK